MDIELGLGVDGIDTYHEQFTKILSKIQSSSQREFHALFEEMIIQTKEHFDYEEKLMHLHVYDGIDEHLSEHRSLLGEMEHFFERSKRFPQMGRSYIDHYAYDKFRWHILNLDARLAMFLKEKGLVDTL